jgi:hypothetical protein
MPLHLIKLSVGIETVDHLATVQARRRADNGQNKLWHQTRQTPTRGDELLDGGSIYWVIKGVLQVRQRIVGLETIRDSEGVRRCRIMLDSTLALTEHRRRRPFQGWRYLAAADAPRDLGDSGENGDMPPELVSELRSLGLL